MHAGRQYPYHPDYWSTEAWFWRGHVPFKLHAETTDVTVPPFSIIPFPWSALSDPGQPSDDRKSITYEIAVFPPAAYPALIVTMDLLKSEPEWQARWRATLRDGGGAWGTAFLLQPYPQRVVLAERFDYVVPSPPYTGSQGPPIKLRPATYAEGGSPWPHY